MEWACLADAARALSGKKTYDTWQEGILQIFEAVLENKPFILNAYRSLNRERMERYLYRLTYRLIRDVVEEQARYHRSSSRTGPWQRPPDRPTPPGRRCP